MTLHPSRAWFGLPHAPATPARARFDPRSIPLRNESNPLGCVLFDWGDTLMRDFPGFSGPMAGWHRVEALPHAQATLDALRLGGWTTALATNAADSDEWEIRRALGRVGLEDLIDRIYCLRTVGHRKPSPEFFDFVLADLRITPADLVMVGNDYDVDIVGANGAGVRAIWFRPEGGELPPEHALLRIVRDLAQIPEILADWGREQPA